MAARTIPIWAVVFILILTRAEKIGIKDHDWVDSFLVTAASQIGGRWLGAWVIFSAGVSNVALLMRMFSFNIVC